MVGLYENVVSEKLEVMSSTFKTYVFSIGKNLLSNFQKKSKAIIVEENTWDNDYVSHVTEHFEYAKTEKEGVLMRMIASLGSPCKEILELFYYKNFSMDSIASALAYNSSSVAKVQKNRCMNRLRTQLTQQYKIEDL